MSSKLVKSRKLHYQYENLESRKVYARILYDILALLYILTPTRFKINFSRSSYSILLATHFFSFRRNRPFVGHSFHRKVPIQSGDFHVGENPTNRTSILGLEIDHSDTRGHQACSTRAERNL